MTKKDDLTAVESFELGLIALNLMGGDLVKNPVVIEIRNRASTRLVQLKSHQLTEGEVDKEMQEQIDFYEEVLLTLKRFTPFDGVESTVKNQITGETSKIIIGFAGDKVLYEITVLEEKEKTNDSKKRSKEKDGKKAGG